MSNDQRDEFVFIWKIDNFPFCSQKRDQYLSSPNFTVEILNGSEWSLQLYPRGRVEERDGSLSCFLEQDEEAKPYDVPFDVTIEIIGAGGKLLKVFEGNYELTHEDQNAIGSFSLVEYRESTEKTSINMEEILTVQCYIYGKASENKSIVKRRARTVVNDHRLIFDVKVMCDFDEGHIVSDCRERITFPGDDSFEFIVTGTPRNFDVKILKNESKSHNGHYVEFKLTLRGRGERDVYTERATHFFQSDDIPEMWQFPSGIISKLIVHNWDCRFDLPDVYWYDIIHLRCELACSSGSVIHEFTDAVNYPTLQEDLRDILKNKTFSDITLQVDDQLIDAHKNILCARSPYFSAMFRQNMMKTHVDIDDIDFDTLKLFLEFLYTDTVKEMDYDRARNLLLAADKYIVLSLKKKCLGFLQTVISVENVCEILSLADVFTDPQLKSNALDFISANSAEINSLPDLTLWMEANTKLASEVSAILNPIRCIKLDDDDFPT